MYNLFSNENNINYSINECTIQNKSESTISSPYSLHVIVLNNNNQAGIEYTYDRIRINDLIVSDKESFFKIMDALVIYARQYDYELLYYGGLLSDKYLEYFLSYGFEERQNTGLEPNHYLYYYFPTEK